MSIDRRRGRPALWDPSRDDRDYFGLQVMLLEWAGEKPLKPYALARAALAYVRRVFEVGAVLEKCGAFELDEATFCGMLLDLKDKMAAADEETRERWRQIGKEELARKPLIDHSPYRYGDELIHIKRLGYKFQDLLIEAEVSLFLKDFPDGDVDDLASYCPSEAEKHQEALTIITRLMDEQLDKSDTEDAAFATFVRGFFGSQREAWSGAV